jgi:hypothetical protein
MKKWQKMQVGKEMTLAHLYGMPKSLFVELSWRGPGKYFALFVSQVPSAKTVQQFSLF